MAREVNAVLDRSMLLGMIMANQRRVGIAVDSSSIEDIRSTRNIPLVTRQASIISGLKTAIPQT